MPSNRAAIFTGLAQQIAVGLDHYIADVNSCPKLQLFAPRSEAA
jgi:hypothetical protein